MGLGYDGYMDLVRAIKLNKKEWEEYLLWRTDGYSRNCLISSESFEVILVCWLKGQSSPIHSYDYQQGWIKVLEGELVVETYAVDLESKTANLNESFILKEGEYCYFNDSMGFHKVYSPNSKTVSLHLNVERITKWKEFNPVSGELTTTIPKYDQISKYCD